MNCDLKSTGGYLLLGFRLGHWLTLVLAAKFYSDNSLYFAQDLIVWNTLPELVFVDDLRFFADFSSKLFLCHALLISALLNQFSDIHTNGLKIDKMP